MEKKNWGIKIIRYFLILIIMGLAYGMLSFLLDYLFMMSRTNTPTIKRQLYYSLAYPLYFYFGYTFVYIPFTIIMYLLTWSIREFKQVFTQCLFAIILGMVIGYVYYRDLYSNYIGGSDYLETGRQVKMMMAFSLLGIVYVLLNKYFLRKWLKNSGK